MTRWSLEIAIENVRGAQRAYARQACITRQDCALALDPPSWWPKAEEHSHAVLSQRLDRLEHAHSLASACLMDLEALFKLAAEEAGRGVTA